MGIREPREAARTGGGRRVAPILLFACLLLLAGCGRPSGTAAMHTLPGSGAAAPGDEAVPSDAELVSAVTPTGSAGTAGTAGAPGAAGGAGSVGVKFRLAGRPTVGTPVKITVALMAPDDADVGHVHGSFSAGAGLLVQSAQTFDIADLRGGAPQYQEVTVVPQQTGVLDLNTTLLLQTDTATQTRTYTIPLIAADNSGP